MHTFWNAGPGPARLLEVIAPAGFETSVVTIGPNDGRELSSANDIYGHYGDYLGRKDQLVTDGLVFSLAEH